MDDEELARRLQTGEDQHMYQQQQQHEGPFLEFEFEDDEELNYDQLGYEVRLLSCLAHRNLLSLYEAAQGRTIINSTLCSTCCPF